MLSAGIMYFCKCCKVCLNRVEVGCSLATLNILHFKDNVGVVSVAGPIGQGFVGGVFFSFLSFPFIFL